MKPTPTHSRSRVAILWLLTLSAAFSLAAAEPETLTAVTTRDQKVVRRWSLPGDPRGVAVGRDGTLYVGLAEPQAVIAVDPKTGAVRKRLVLDSAEIASTKELVTLRTNAAGSRLYIANGSDESVTILALPELAVLREITIEGEAIRDALPDPKGRYLYLLGRTVHVYDIEGREELHRLPLEDPMAIAATADAIAVVGTEDYGPARATTIALYDTTRFAETTRDPLETTERIEAAMFAAGDRALVAASRTHLYEKSLTARPARTMTAGADGRMRISIGPADVVNSYRICLPEQSGAGILALAPGNVVIFGERRCSNSGAFTGADRRIVPASLYGSNAYAVAYDSGSNTVVATEPGFLTIYRLPATR